MVDHPPVACGPSPERAALRPSAASVRDVGQQDEAGTDHETLHLRDLDNVLTVQRIVGERSNHLCASPQPPRRTDLAEFGVEQLVDLLR